MDKKLYIVIEEVSKDKFESEISEKIREGYMPVQGTFQAISIGGGVVKFIQPMLLLAEITNEVVNNTKEAIKKIEDMIDDED